MKNRPLLIIAFAAVIVLWSMHQSLGGVDGIRSEPGMALFVLGFTGLIAGPLFWFRYRRLKREPMYEEISDAHSAPPPDGALEQPPTLLVASRRKLLALLLIFIVGSCFAAFMLWRQPGVCGIVGLASLAPGVAFALIVGVAGLISRERLEITRQGLKHITFWRSQFWSWDQIRNLTLINARAFGLAWTSGIAFNLFSADRYAAGPARVTLRAVWRIDVRDLAEIMNRARLQWSSPAAAHFFPVQKGLAHHICAALPWVFAAGMLYLFVGRPCG